MGRLPKGRKGNIEGAGLCPHTSHGPAPSPRVPTSVMGVFAVVLDRDKLHPFLLSQVSSSMNYASSA